MAVWGDRVDQLRAAVASRAGWHVDQDGAAVYRPEGTAAEVRVRPIARPDERRRYNFSAALAVGGQVTLAASCWSAAETVAWAERRWPRASGQQPG
jgi:hypothetical protein